MVTNSLIVLFMTAPTNNLSTLSQIHAITTKTQSVLYKSSIPTGQTLIDDTQAPYVHKVCKRLCCGLLFCDGLVHG